MATTTWKQVVYDVADAVREVNGTTDAIPVGELATMIGELRDTSDATIIPYDIGNGEVAYGSNGKIVGESPFKYLSGGGIGSIALPSSARWSSVTYGDGKFVAITSNSDKVSYSMDGITWEESILPYSLYWSDVNYGNGTFVAVGSDYRAAYSTDGITWKPTTLPSNQNWYAVAYGNDKFVTTCDGNSVIAYSTDGITWEQIDALPYSASWNSITYGNGKFVAVSSHSGAAAYSLDGITWTETSLPCDGNWSLVQYGNGKFVAIRYHSVIAAYSTDGITWTEVELPSVSAQISMVYGAEKFVIYSSGGEITYSTDGIMWNEIVALSSDVDWDDMSYGDGKFVLVAKDSDKVAYSTDGLTWTDEINLTYEFVDYHEAGIILYANNCEARKLYVENNEILIDLPNAEEVAW